MLASDNDTSGATRRFASGLFASARSLVGHWWPTATSIAGTAALAVAGASPSAKFEIGGHTHRWRPVLIVIGLALFALAAVNTARRQRRLDQLQEEHKRFADQAEAGARALLRLIFHELGALRDAAGYLSAERVSLLRCEGDHFILIGRRSANPTYDRGLGRQRYPEDEGCIATAWQESKTSADDLPAPGNTKPWNEEWLGAQEELGVPRVVAEDLTMPSRSYFVFRIEGPERALGVIVFESINTSAQAAQLKSHAALSVEQLEPVFRTASRRLSHLLQESRCISAAQVAQLLPQIRN